MRQLVQLNQSAAKFEEMGVEVIAVFREEREGVAGLQKIKDKTETNFTLALDTGARQTAKYSPGRREFDNYVIDSKGNIVAMIDGTLKSRATSEQIMAALESISTAEEAPAEEAAEPASGTKETGSETKKAGSGVKEAGSETKASSGGSRTKKGSGSR